MGIKVFSSLIVVLFFVHSALADDCQFIRDQIAKLPPLGGVVRIKAGTYNCTAPINIEKNNVIVKGEGTGKSIMRLADNVHAPLLVIGSSATTQDSAGHFVTPFRVHNITLEGLSFDGNKAHHDPTKECGEKKCDQDATSIRNNSISIRGASDIRLVNIEAHDSISGGLVTEKNCDHLKVMNFDSHDNFYDGFAGYETTKSEFIGMHLHDNKAAGISADIRFNDNKFIGGLIADNHDVGLFGRDMKNNLFDRTVFDGDQSFCTFLSFPEKTTGQCADNNEFRDVKFKNCAKSGFFASPECHGNKLTGSTVFDSNHQGAYDGDLLVSKSVRIIPYAAPASVVAPAPGKTAQ